jgi:hypothetical protein
MSKEPENVGKYLHPTELGQPITSEINYELNHPKMYTEDPEAQRGTQSLRKGDRK